MGPPSETQLSFLPAKLLLTCVGGVGRRSINVVDVPVDGGQALDDLSAQASVLQLAPARLIDGVLSLTLGAEQAVALNQVLAQVNFGAGILEGAAAVRRRTFVVVRTQLTNTEDVLFTYCKSLQCR